MGFYAVLPFLATHLGTAIGMAGWMVGFVLGLRTFSQQGLFVVGGWIVDRHGVRPLVLVGCVLRIAGFACLGYAEATWTVIGAVLLIGVAAALFSPAVESEVARQAVIWEEEGHGSRTRVLALLSAAGQVGAFVGPLLGALLLAVDFRTICLAGAGVFVLVLAGHMWLMPQHIPGRVGIRERGGMRVLLRNRRFLSLCCPYGTYLLAYNQLYLALPDEVQRATESQEALSWLFALSSLLVVCATCRFQGPSNQPSGCKPASPSRTAGSPAASVNAVRASIRTERCSGARRSTIAAISCRREAVTSSTSLRPSSVTLSAVSRRLAGLVWRSARPAAISRSIMRIAVEGLTPSRSASTTSLAGPRVHSTTSSRNCGSVTRSSTAARERAETATSRREAVSTARVTASTSSMPRRGFELSATAPFYRARAAPLPAPQQTGAADLRRIVVSEQQHGRIVAQRPLDVLDWVRPQSLESRLGVRVLEQDRSLTEGIKAVRSVAGLRDTVDVQQELVPGTEDCVVRLRSARAAHSEAERQRDARGLGEVHCAVGANEQGSWVTVVEQSDALIVTDLRQHRGDELLAPQFPVGSPFEPCAHGPQVGFVIRGLPEGTEYDSRGLDRLQALALDIAHDHASAAW